MAPCVHVAISELNDSLLFVSKGIATRLSTFFSANVTCNFPLFLVTQENVFLFRKF